MISTGRVLSLPKQTAICFINWPSFPPVTLYSTFSDRLESESHPVILLQGQAPRPLCHLTHGWVDRGRFRHRLPFGADPRLAPFRMRVTRPVVLCLSFQAALSRSTDPVGQERYIKKGLKTQKDFHLRHRDH